MSKQLEKWLESSLVSKIDGKIDTADKGAVNGVAELDGAGKVPTAQLPTKMMEFEGSWNATTNTPTLANTDTGLQGTVYKVTVAGSVDFGAGSIAFDAGDWVYNNGTIWDKSDNVDQVTSVAAKTGAVTLDTDDVSEATNLYFTDARARTAAVDDTIYGAGWNGVTNQAPSKNAVYDKIVLLEAAISGAGGTSKIEELVISSADLTAGYKDMAEIAKADSMSVIPAGAPNQLQEGGANWTISLTGGAGGKTRVLFTAAGDLATTLADTDVVLFKYEY